MAVNELDARTRAVEKMKAEPGKEMATYQAAENQLLAIRAEQKQNLAIARQEGAAAIQQNATIGQAAELAASSAVGGGTAVQAPVNTATQNVLAKYGAGPTISKSTQRSTQQVTKQNITINNYNTTTNNTTNNVPNTGPVQGRPVVVNRDDTGRFKVWVNNALARQNEQAAIRDKEYQRRENALTRSANKMTRKLEAVSLSISKHLDPRKQASTFGDQVRRILKLIGIGVIAANWPKVMDILGNIEYKVRTFLEYVGITGSEGRKESGERSGLVKDIKYILLGKKGEEVKGKDGKEGGIVDALREAFTGKDGIWESIKKSIEVWMDSRSEAIKAVPFPELSKNPAKIGESLGKIAGYVGDILSAILQGPGATAKRAAREARDEAVQESISEKNDSRANKRLGDFISSDGKTHSSSVGDYVMHGYKGANNLLASDIKDNKLANNIGASIRQSNYIATNLAGENGKVNPLGIIEGLNKLETSAVDNKYTIVDPYLLGMLQSKLGVYTQDLEGKKKEFKYISIAKTEEEKEHERESNSGLTTASKWVGGTAGFIGGAFTGTPSGMAAGTYAGAKAAGKLTDWLASEENTIKLVEKDDPTYKDYPSINKQLDGLTEAQKEKLEYLVLTKEDIETIKKRLAEKLGKESISFDVGDLESTQLLGEYITNQLKGQEVSETYTKGIANIKEAQKKVDAVKEKQKEIWNNSKVAGIGSRTSEKLSDLKDFGTSGYTQSISDEDSRSTEQKKTKLKRIAVSAAGKIKKKANWDVDKAIEAAQENVNVDGVTGKSKNPNKSIKKCYRYVENAIDAGFGEPWKITETIGSSKNTTAKEAKDAGPYLLDLGFKEISNDSTWEKGDIHVYQHPDRPGHIEIYDGKNWISDFKQLTPGYTEGFTSHPYTAMNTFRWNEIEDSNITDENSEDEIPDDIKMDQSTLATAGFPSSEELAQEVTQNSYITHSPENDILFSKLGQSWDESAGMYLPSENETLTVVGSYKKTKDNPSLDSGEIETKDLALASKDLSESVSQDSVNEKLDDLNDAIQQSNGFLALITNSTAKNVDVTSDVALAVRSSNQPTPLMKSSNSFTSLPPNGDIS